MIVSDDGAKAAALKNECLNQFQNCGYTALSFTIWLRCLRWVRLAGLIAPVVFGALAARGIITQTAPAFAAVCALLAAAIPSVIQASKLYDSIEQYTTFAGEFTNLRDRFRQLADITSLKPYGEFDAAFEKERDRLEKARRRPLSPPEWCFRWAQRKWQSGHYDPDPN